MILYRSECPGRNGACGAAWMALRRAALPKWTALYFLHPNIELSTRQLLQHVDDGFEERHVASTGIVAVVFALRICKRISLFGFNGSVIGDREVRTNIVWRGHHLLAERHLIHWLETCHDGPFAHLCRRLKIYS